MFRIASLLRRTAGFAALITCIGVSVAHGAEPTGRGADSPNTPDDFTKTSCAELASESTENRSFALMFYYGYMAGRFGATTMDETQLPSQLAHVRDYCNVHPESTVVDAFIQALKPTMRQ